MEVKKAVVGILKTNCYLLIKDKAILIIDPGDEAEKISSLIYASGFLPRAILLTHGHWDHFGASAALRDEFGVKIYVHELDRPYVNDPYECTFKDFPFLKDYGTYVDELLTEGSMTIEEFSFEVIHTPGHSRGSCCFYFPDKKILFSGDVLFRGSIGRVDLPCSEPEKMQQSLKKLSSLPDDVVVYPGHGMSTTIEIEKQYNPYFSAL